MAVRGAVPFSTCRSLHKAVEHDFFDSHFFFPTSYLAGNPIVMRLYSTNVAPDKLMIRGHPAERIEWTCPSTSSGAPFSSYRPCIQGTYSTLSYQVSLRCSSPCVSTPTELNAFQFGPDQAATLSRSRLGYRTSAISCSKFRASECCSIAMICLCQAHRLQVWSPILLTNTPNSLPKASFALCCQTDMQHLCT